MTCKCDKDNCNCQCCNEHTEFKACKECGSKEDEFSVDVLIKCCSESGCRTLNLNSDN
jgi:hypothetical protein